MNGGDPMEFLMQVLGSGGNPQQLAESLMMKNPQFKAAMNQQKQSGMSRKEYVMNYAKQNNIDIQPMLNMLTQMGYKL